MEAISIKVKRKLQYSTKPSIFQRLYCVQKEKTKIAKCKALYKKRGKEKDRNGEEFTKRRHSEVPKGRKRSGSCGLREEI